MKRIKMLRILAILLAFAMTLNNSGMTVLASGRIYDETEDVTAFTDVDDEIDADDVDEDIDDIIEGEDSEEEVSEEDESDDVENPDVEEDEESEDEIGIIDDDSIDEDDEVLIVDDINKLSANYDASAAVAFSYSHVYTDQSWECAEYVSRCLNAGGVGLTVQKGVKGLYETLLKYDTFVPYQLSYNAGNDYMYANGSNANKVSVGDAIIIRGTGGRPYLHAVIVSKIDSNGIIYYNAHNVAVKDEPKLPKYHSGSYSGEKGNITFTCFHYTGQFQDTTPPSITNVRITEQNDNYCTYTYVWSDNVGVVKERIRLYSPNEVKEYVYTDKPTTDKTYESTFRFKWANMPNGDYYITITQWDAAGNETTVTSPVATKNTVDEGSEMPTGYDRTIPDGDYIIASVANPNKSQYYYVDIEGIDVPAANKTNVSLCGLSANPSEPDIWTLSYNNGFYTIKQKGTEMALDVLEADKHAGTNVQVWGASGGSNQEWAISHNGSNGYRIQSRCSGMSLDTANGEITNGANILQNTSSDSASQVWMFIPYNPQQTLDNGKYIFVSTLDENYAMGINKYVLRQDVVEVQLSGSLTDEYNVFEISKLENGYYKIINSGTKMALDMTGGGSSLGDRVYLYEENGTIAQQWELRKNNDGYSFIVRCSGLTIGVSGDQVFDGNSIIQWTFHGGKSETWKIVPAEYTITYDANGGQNAPGAQIKKYKQDISLSSSIPTYSGYTFKGWSTDKNAQNAEYQPGDAYSVDEDVTMYAVWDKHSVTDIFVDVNPGAWYVEAIQFVYDRGIMAGTGTGDTFEPNSPLTRGQFVTVIYSMEGKPAVEYESIFTDVSESAYYALPTIWAYKNGITAGTGNGKFSPNKNITREQLAVMLYKYASIKDYDVSINESAINGYTDKDKISSYATEAMKWAVTQGIISGKGEILDPQGNATRAECATMIMNLIKKNK